jgi:hypothetical protein
MLGGGFGLPEVKAIMLKELRETNTPEAISQLPSVSSLRHMIEPKPMTGLVEWYRIWMRTRTDA